MHLFAFSAAFLGVTLLAALAAPAARADTAEARVRTLIETFKKVAVAPEGGKLSNADRQANLSVYKKLDGFFAFDHFGAACLGAARSKMTDKQATAFSEQLVDIMRRQGYANAGALFRDGTLKYGKIREGNSGTVTPIVLHFPKQDVDMTLEFVWGKDLRIIDVIMDDDSLTKDFGNQIGRVVNKGGIEELGKRLAQRQSELAAEGL